MQNTVNVVLHAKDASYSNSTIPLYIYYKLHKPYYYYYDYNHTIFSHDGFRLNCRSVIIGDGFGRVYLKYADYITT